MVSLYSEAVYTNFASVVEFARNYSKSFFFLFFKSQQSYYDVLYMHYCIGLSRTALCLKICDSSLSFLAFVAIFYSI